MEIYKKASLLKLRFPTAKGFISIEDLWDLSLTSLDSMYKTLNKFLTTSKEESLLSVKSSSDELVALRVEIIKDVVTTKQEEAKKRVSALLKKQQREKIQNIIAEKKDASLSSKSLAELEAMLKDSEEEA